MDRSAMGTPAAPDRRRWGRLAAALYFLLVAAVAGVALRQPASFEDPVEGFLISWRFRLRDAYWRFRNPDVDWRERARVAKRLPALPPEVAIVVIDERSIARYGSWPWPRFLVAELIEKIGTGRPRALGIDLVLHDPAPAWDDARIAQALATVSGRVAAAVTLRLGPPFTGAVPERLLAGAIVQIDRSARLLPLEAAQALLPPGANAGTTVALGHVSYSAAGGGEVRHESLYLRYGGALIPSLGFQTARIAAGLPPEAVRVRGDGGVELGGMTIPADRRGRLPVNYYGGEGLFPRYSAAAVLSGEMSPSEFEGDVVFVGGAADIATVDFVDTPFAENLPAVEKEATVAANILARDFLREAPASANLLVLLAAGIAVPLLVRRRAALSLLSLLGLVLVLVAANFAFFLRGFLLTLSWPLLVLVLAGGGVVAWQHVVEFRLSRRMRRLFSSYVTERVVERLIAEPAMARLGGERREVTILFADIRGFTTFSEKHPPEEVVRTLNEYLGAMTEVIFRWEGTLDKFIGDTILAFWGAPLPQTDHPERALRCALHLCSRLDGLNAAWTAAGRPPLEIGVGVSTGSVLVGNIGAEGKKMDYTVIGDQVNLCSRVEELTKSHRTRILITASTFERVQPLLANGGIGHVAVEGPVEVVVKGREEAVSVYRVTPKEHGEPAAAFVFPSSCATVSPCSENSRQDNQGG